MTLNVGFVDIWGNAQQVDVSLTPVVADLPVAYRQLGVVGARISLSAGGPYYVQGTPAAVRSTILAAIAQNEEDGEEYAPTVTSSGAAVVAAVGTFKALKRNGRVHVVGRFTFNPAVPGTPEDVTLTLPPGMLPTANFGATTDGGGLVSGGLAAADFVTGNVSAVVGAKTMKVIGIDQTTASACVYGVAFEYEIA